MFKVLLVAFCSCLFAFISCASPLEPSEQHPLPPYGRNIPDDYALLYAQDFSTERVLEDFEMTDPSTWRLGTDNGDHFLELFQGVGAYRPRVRSPRSIALLTKVAVGDFILEIDAESTDIHDGAHRDVCFFFGAKDPSNFYYAHIATKADPNAHNIFLVNDAPRTNIAEQTTGGVEWGVGIRHRIRIERTIEDGKIRVFFNDMATPIMEATDHHFDFGHVGFGSFDNTCRFYEMRLYASSEAPRQDDFFQ